HKRGGTQRLAPTAPPPPRAPAFPTPDRAALRPLQPPPGPRQVREVPTPPPHAGAAGLATAHWLRSLLGDEQPRPALVGWVPPSLLLTSKKTQRKRKPYPWSPSALLVQL
ncbi:hypothetical protein H1C71_034049, partial [Ictidomys tridecemlineatus]